MQARTTPAEERPPRPCHELMKAKEVAQLLRIGIRCLFRYVERGLIPPPCLKIGWKVLRWRREEIEAFVAGDWKPAQVNGNGQH